MTKPPTMAQKPIADMFGPLVTEQDIAVVVDALRNGWYGRNAYKYCEMFEREFADYHGRRFALMTPNCTSAIHLLLAGLGIAPGDEVIVPECTWIASAAPITYQRAKTVFADIDPVHWCLTPETTAAKITPRTKAIILVDLYGNMPDWDEMQALADRHGIALIEDAAEALGSTYRSRRAGKLGVGSVFSFHRTKTITTGEGGILLLDDEKLFERCKLLRDHGRSPASFYNVEVAFKYMPSNMQAALAHAQFQRIDELVGRKRAILQGYQEELGEIPDVTLNYEQGDRINGAWCTTIVIGPSHGRTAAEVMAVMKESNVTSRPFFWPLSALPAYGSQGDKYRSINPVSYATAERGIVLPSAYTLTRDDIARVSAPIRGALRQ